MDLLVNGAKELAGMDIILEAVTKHIKDTRVNENIHHGFIKVKSCLVNLVAFLL